MTQETQSPEEQGYRGQLTTTGFCAEVCKHGYPGPLITLCSTLHQRRRHHVKELSGINMSDIQKQVSFYIELEAWLTFSHYHRMIHTCTIHTPEPKIKLHTKRENKEVKLAVLCWATLVAIACSPGSQAVNPRSNGHGQ